MKKSVSIIIVTYKSKEYLWGCLDSILRFNDINNQKLEVIIVDHSPAEFSTELRKISEEHPLARLVRILFIHNESNTGYGAGNNLGIRNSSGDIICIMNPDVRFTSFLLNKVIKHFDSESNAGILSFKQIGGNNLTFYRRPEHKMHFIDGIVTKYRNRKDRFNSKKDFLSGAFFFADRQKFIEIGLFDENIFMYNEESDIARRFLQRGYALHYDASNTYLHLIESREFNEIAFKEEIISLRYYIEKFNLNADSIWRKYLQEVRFKLIISKMLRRSSDINRFSKMISVIKINRA